MLNRKWTSHARAMAMVLTALGAFAWAGCGPAANGGDYYCDGTGCYQCDAYSCRSVSGPPGTPSAPLGCNRSADCGEGYSCIGQTCVPCDGGTSVATTDGGASSTDAASSTGDSSAPPGDSGSARADSGPTCGNGNGPCACTSSAECAASQVCVAGSCTASSNACQFTSQCAPGDVCADNQCVPACGSSGACASGSTCQKGVCEPTPVGAPCTTSAQCSGSTPVCAEGECTASCSSDATCPTGDYCNQGACEVDTRPKPDCTQPSDCKAGPPQACLDGYCVYTCATNTQCADIDVRIDVCSTTHADAGTVGYCESPTQAAPQCTSKSECPSSEDCINNVCE